MGRDLDFILDLKNSRYWRDFHRKHSETNVNTELKLSTKLIEGNGDVRGLDLEWRPPRGISREMQQRPKSSP